jgi:hypothetical protein
MPLDYKSATISVTTAGTVVDPNFDIDYFSVSSESGDFLFRLKDESGWGDWVSVAAGIAFEDTFKANQIEMKAATGTVSVDYYLKGNR